MNKNIIVSRLNTITYYIKYFNSYCGFRVARH